MSTAVNALKRCDEADAGPARTVAFEVRKANFAEHRLAEAPSPPLEPGQILLAVEKFALTANNISYALAGDRLGYWDYFPSGEPLWGRLPAFGFLEVVQSRCDAVSVGERFYGYVPMASHVVMRPTRVGERTFIDAYDRRAALHEAYNTYYRWDEARGGRPDLFPALNPLFMTSWLYFDYLAEKGYFGAEQVILLGASSKTGLALAHFLSGAAMGRRVCVGVTSARNRAFVQQTGCFDRVLSYDEVDGVIDLPSVVVDFSGDGEVVGRVHARLGGQIVLSSRIGQTHWDADRAPRDLPGPKPAFFFAPGHVQEGVAIWGEQAFHDRADQAWLSFLAAAETWFEVQRGEGAAALAEVYDALVAGVVDPSRAHILSLGA